MLTALTSMAQPAKGANKFLGNTTTQNAVRSDFLTWWNQITPENESKWANVEPTRGNFNFARVDSVKNFAEKNHIPWKIHTLIWGSQYPSWITSLSQADQLAAVTKWMDTMSQRYPNVDMIDVVNEGYPSHKPPPYKAALGGDGTTGYDWIIKSFQMARQRWPKAILIYNDYNIIEWKSEVNWTVTMITALIKANAPINAIGCQAHDVYNVATDTVKKNINKLAALGLPLVITEFDIPNSNDNNQQTIMKDKFTMMWTHPKIVGITYWGYIVGSTWKTGSGLVNTNKTERPAMTWLKTYIDSNPNPPNDFPNLFNHTPPTGINSRYETINKKPAAINGSGLTEVFDVQGRKIGSFKSVNSMSSMKSAKKTYVIKKDGHSAGVSNNVR